MKAQERRNDVYVEVATGKKEKKKRDVTLDQSVRLVFCNGEGGGCAALAGRYKESCGGEKMGFMYFLRLM